MNHVTISAQAPEGALTSEILADLKDIVRTYEGTMSSSNVYGTGERKRIGIAFTTDVPIQDAITSLIHHVEGVGWELKHTSGNPVSEGDGCMEVLEL